MLFGTELEAVSHPCIYRLPGPGRPLALCTICWRFTAQPIWRRVAAMQGQCVHRRSSGQCESERLVCRYEQTSIPMRHRAKRLQSVSKGLGNHARTVRLSTVKTFVHEYCLRSEKTLRHHQSMSPRVFNQDLLTVASVEAVCCEDRFGRDIRRATLEIASELHIVNTARVPNLRPVHPESRRVELKTMSGVWSRYSSVEIRAE